MGNLKKLMLFLLCISLSTAAFAKQITIQIIQHDITTDTVEESSLVVEDQLMDGFFDNGFIVSNTPASVSNSEVQDLTFFNSGIGDAYEGGADYFVQIKLYYDNSSVAPAPVEKGKKGVGKRVICLERVDWTVASATTGRTIKESTLPCAKLGIKDDLKLISDDLIFEIKKAIKA